MKNYESLSHTRYDCKYHVVFIPKYRRKKIYGAIRRHLGEIFHELAKQQESRILEGHLKGDHVHARLSARASAMAVSSVQAPAGRSNGPPPTMSSRRGCVSREQNSSVVPTASCAKTRPF